MNTPKPYRITTLVFIRNSAGEHLLLRRRNPPNKGLWSPIGGKLDTLTGESPTECAIREAGEEAGLALHQEDLHLFACISERDYEGSGHWLMFLFQVLKPMDKLPPPHPEGEFGFHPSRHLELLPIPDSDRQVIWPLALHDAHGFTAGRLVYHPPVPPSGSPSYEWTVETRVLPPF